MHISFKSIIRLRYASTVGVWVTIFVLLLCSYNSFAKSPKVNNQQIELGKRIFLQGILPNGKPLIGKRANGVQVEGADGACVNCHRRSGMGSLEGNIVSPPITGQFLFTQQEERPRALVDVREPKNVTKARPAYHAQSFARAIRNGVRVDGRELNSLMPRYVLSEQDLNALTAYLNQLSVSLSPGVGDDTLTFATVVTPGVDAAKRDAMIKMMNTAFKQRNASQEDYSGRMRMPIDLIPRTRRNWELKVWYLTGAPETWVGQLAGLYREQPVFALISGLSETTWAPIHDFCQAHKLPCLLPSTLLPPDRSDFYSLYYSRGMALAADVLAKHLRSQENASAKRLIQVYRDNSAGAMAAQKLAEDLKNAGIQVENRVLQPDSVKAVGLFDNLNKDDRLVLWLKSEDLSLLGKSVDKLPVLTYLSGYQIDDHNKGIVQSWYKDIRVVYPYELGKNRQKSDAALKTWLSAWSLPVVDTAFQAEVFFNLLFITDVVSQMLDNLYADYMIERAEDMLSAGTNYSAYPHLGLSRGQRFASKGAYIARLNDDGSLVPDSEWLVP